MAATALHGQPVPRHPRSGDSGSIEGQGDRLAIEMSDHASIQKEVKALKLTLRHSLKGLHQGEGLGLLSLLGGEG